MKIMNLRKNFPTYEQLQAGVENVDKKQHEEIKNLLTFKEFPDVKEMEERAEKLVQIVKDEGFDMVLIGGVPYFMSTLEKVLKKHRIKPLYYHSKRTTEEVLDKKTGEVIKRKIFKEVGFIEV